MTAASERSRPGSDTTFTLLDLGVGNLHSLSKALIRAGARVRIEDDPGAALHAEALVLPGVGAFGAAAERLAPVAGGIRERLDAGMPCLGICLGMQLLFRESEESAGSGIGLFDADVRRLRADRLPQMGWNEVETGDDELFRGAGDPVVYYANSYAAEVPERGQVIGWTDYQGDRFPAAVRLGNVWGTQFHPEKSGAAGLRLIANFVRAARRPHDNESATATESSP